MRSDIKISDQGIARYQRDGAVLIKHALQAEDLRLLEQGVEEAYADPGNRSAIVKSPDGGGETLVETSPSHRSASLGALLDSAIAAEIASRVMQTSSAQLIFEQMFYKTRGRIMPTPWHQDTPFLRV